MLVDISMHVLGIRELDKFDVCRAFSTHGESEPSIVFVLTTSADERTVLILEAVVGEVVTVKAVRV